MKRYMRKLAMSSSSFLIKIYGFLRNSFQSKHKGANRCKSGEGYIHSDELLDGDSLLLLFKSEPMSSRKTPGGDGASLKSRHQSAKQPLLNQVLSQPKHVLVKEYFKEMDLKNQAYYFIIQSGLMDQFVEFNQEEDGK